MQMRVAVISESPVDFANGVANSVVKTLEHLRRNGHDALVVAPSPVPSAVAGYPTVGVRSIPLPRYRSYRLGLSTTSYLHGVLAGYRPHIVHLAGPAVIGTAAMRAAKRLSLPTVAIFQTDAAGFAARHGFGMFGPMIWHELRRLHDAADLTLVPSTDTQRQLEERGFTRMALWRRGVDIERFNPSHRDEELRRSLAPGGETIIGYVGRLSREKRVHLLAHLTGIPNTKLVVVGDGPDADLLRRRIPNAVLTGLKRGEELSRLVASLDVFVHTGANETYCQAVQEALAAGVPVVAPAAGGPIDLVEENRTGFLYPPDDTAALRTAVDRLASSEALRAEMGRQARASVEHRTWDAICEELLGHYRKVLSDYDLSRKAMAVS
jgi:phosphatidylinositol alpha 1,6-mannosyltransferase